jgi:Ca2+-binding RTX toxin-like protein
MTSYVPAGSEFDVNSTFARTQAQSDGAQLADGRSIVTWVDADFNTTAGRFIRAQLFQSDGTSVGTELTLVSGSAFINPAVTGLSGGGFVLTWVDLFGVRAQVFDQHGVAVAPLFSVSPLSANTIGPPDVAALETGGFAIVWHDTRTTGGGDVSGSAVHLRAFDAAGAPVGSDRIVNGTTAGNQADSSITALHDGHYVVTWTDRGAPGGNWLIKGRILDAAGTPLGSEFTVNASTSFVSSVESSVTTLANGNFAVAWNEFTQAGGSSHQIQVFDHSGAAVGSRITVPQNLTGTQVGPKLVGLADGGFAIAWTANASPQSDGSGKGIFVQIFDDHSQAAGGPMLVNTQANGDQFDPALTAFAGGGFVVSWTDLNGPGADDDQVKAQLFLPPRPITITSDGGGDNAAIAVDENQTLVTHVASAGGSSATYAIDGGADAALFTIDPVTGVLRFVHVPDFEAPGGDGDNLYLVRVRASNGAFTDTQTLTVTVGNVNEAPVITSHGGGDTAAVSVAENTAAVTTVTASDPDAGQTLGFSIVGGADAALFTINPTTGALAFITAPNFEAPADAGTNNVYDVIVQASDGDGAIDTQTLAVTVGNINEAPVITSNGGGDTAALTVTENTAAVTTVTASDPDAGQTLGFSIVGGADAALFTIDATTGALAFITAPNFEAPADAGTNNVYDVVVQVSDGALSDTQTLAITVGNVNEAPVITSHGGGDTATLTVTENTVFVGTVVASDPEGAVTYSIAGGADVALFTINPTTGALAFITAPNFEAPADAGTNNVYDVVVQVSDGALSDTQTLAITVGNINEAPVITSHGGGDTAAVSVAENTAAVTTVTASDPDAGQTLGFSIVGGADAALFTINPTTGALAFITAPNFEAPADAGANNVYDVVVQVSDGDGAIDTQALAITIGNLNEAPVITSNGGGDIAALTVTENTVFVGTVVASDPEGAVTYSIAGGADAALFTINPTTGALAFVTAPDFEAPADAGADNVYDVVVQASDGDGAIDTQTLAVTVGNINEAPVITSNGGGDIAALTVTENTVVVGTVAASDPDGTTPTYSIAGGADAALFTIDATTGALAFVTAPNFEAPADAGADNVYDVIVQASDGDGAADTQALAVTIQNVGGAAITGTNIADTLTGTREEDVLSGLGGNDTLIAADGNDILDGGTGRDTMAGGMGNDTYVVDNTGDVVTENAGEGTDTVQSSIAYTLGSDVENLTLTGTATINGTGNALGNVLIGNAGNNVLAGLGGADALDGGGGTDTASYAASTAGVSVSLAANTAHGGDAEGDTFISIENLSGSGLDDILEGDAANNVLGGGSGVDTASYEHATAGVMVSLAITGPQHTIGAGIDTLTSIENLTGSLFDDVLTGSSISNLLIGLDGNDVFDGGGGADTLVGGLGNDVLNGGSGADTMIGGTGDDTYVVDNAGDVVTENAGEGTDTVQSSIAYTLGADVENLTLTGSANIIGTGNTADNVLIGNGGNNTLTGLGGADTFDGGAATDTVSYATATAGVSVSLAANTAHGGDAEGDTFISIENLTGSAFDDTLEGDVSNNVLNGGAGTDTASYEHATAGVTVNLLSGGVQNTIGAGNDTLTSIENLTGSLFDDMLTGSASGNVLNGFDGNDVLNGGNGADTLIGGSGADRFVFTALANSSPATPDTVVDFTHGVDLIDLSAIDANTSAAGDQAFAFAGQNANAVAHAVTWYETGGNTVVQVDVNGNTTADLAIMLAGIDHHLSSTDFVL